MPSFVDTSYQRHARSFDADLTDPDRIRVAASWLDTSTADYWANSRCYEIAGILGNVPGERWVTVGDGRFGLDARQLKKRGVHDAIPTDISEVLLRKARETGLISEYSVENAERLSFQDSSFDYVFCKEAYHHFPRPMIAVYEMLRVARKGVILIEPNDNKSSWMRRTKNIVKYLIRRPMAPLYEEDGNYIYSISKREIEKVALGMNIPHIAFKGLNTYYRPGFEFKPLKSMAGYNMRLRVAISDVICALGLDVPHLLMAIIFLSPPSLQQRAAMASAGWEIRDLPRNPYHVL